MGGIWAVWKEMCGMKQEGEAGGEEVALGQRRP